MAKTIKQDESTEITKHEETDKQDEPTESIKQENTDKQDEFVETIKQEEIDNVLFNMYCSPKLKCIIENLTKRFQEFEKDPDVLSCSVCYDKKLRKEFTYLLCSHNFCTECCNRMINTYHNDACPMCRKRMIPIILNDKYAIVCPGDVTYKHLFDNGGLTSVYIFYFPEFKGEKYTIFNQITYHDENPERMRYLEKFIDLKCSNYCIIFKNTKRLIKWSNDVMLKDFYSDILIDLEKIDIKIV